MLQRAPIGSEHFTTTSFTITGLPSLVQAAIRLAVHYHSIMGILLQAQLQIAVKHLQVAAPPIISLQVISGFFRDSMQIPGCRSLRGLEVVDTVSKNAVRCWPFAFRTMSLQRFSTDQEEFLFSKTVKVQSSSIYRLLNTRYLKDFTRDLPINYYIRLVIGYLSTPE
jgi:hypothetical protein